jgi:hypothetical protein
MIAAAMLDNAVRDGGHAVPTNRSLAVSRLTR